MFGTLSQFMGLRKINTNGLEQADKVLHLSAMAYKLKNYLKFDRKRTKSGVGMLALAAWVKSTFKLLNRPSLRYQKLG